MLSGRNCDRCLMTKSNRIELSININSCFFNGDWLCAAVIIKGQANTGSFKMRINRVTKSNVFAGLFSAIDTAFPQTDAQCIDSLLISDILSSKRVFYLASNIPGKVP